MHGRLFAGPEVPLPPAAPRNRVVIHLDQEPPLPVRYTGGYEDFVVFVEDAGSDPRSLRDDLSELIVFLQGHPVVADDCALLQSAGFFFGNSVAQRYPRAAWVVPPDGPEVGPEEEGGFPVITAVRELTAHPDWSERYLAMLSQSLADDHEPR